MVCLEQCRGLRKLLLRQNRAHALGEQPVGNIPRWRLFFEVIELPKRSHGIAQEPAAFDERQADHPYQLAILTRFGNRLQTFLRFEQEGGPLRRISRVEVRQIDLRAPQPVPDVGTQGTHFVAAQPTVAGRSRRRRFTGSIGETRVERPQAIDCLIQRLDGLFREGLVERRQLGLPAAGVANRRRQHRCLNFE